MGLESLDIENKNNTQNIVRIQESIFHQHEQVKKVDAERQHAAQKAKDDYEATVLTNASAIADLKSELTNALLNVETVMREEHVKETKELVEKIEKVENHFDSRTKNIEGRLKKNEDNIKHIDATLDGLKRNDDVQLIKEQINTIENEYNITKKQIKILDNGNQRCLKKCLIYR